MIQASLISIDPGLTDLGLALFSISVKNLELVPRLVEAHHFSSTPDRHLSKAADYARRILQLGDFLDVHISCATNLIGMACEQPTNLRSSVDNAKLHGSWCVILEQCRTRCLELVMMTPKEVRSFYNLDTGASKEDIQEAIRPLFPSLFEMNLSKRSLPHCADAVAIGAAASVMHLNELLPEYERRSKSAS